MAHPFEDEEGVHLVLVDSEEQYSLWPVSRGVPTGWPVAHHADTRTDCLAHVAAHWSDLRPASLRELTDDVREVAR
ncbi:MbtH family NRPS accessory protein [Streptomyces sp. NBC_00083]|uniref:MbtH family protein n=1 Tax=Streptomyces sp. NBC_00083 TaxID=2975647 RepID=UPI00225B949F|nr:MbtH family NRPS accessory protein [Streptomyces sp. NBC_00083]MCX5386216.1 MbtH family NRPS accessory protein [Streptomyces sp. NBC_00083]